MKICGLKIWRDRLTDEQYVEQIRKNLRARRWARYLFAIFGVVGMLASLWGIQLFVQFSSRPGTPPQQQNLVNSVFVIAIVFGMSIGGGLAYAAQCIASALFEQRKNRMLVECWDALNDVIDTDSAIG